MTNLIPEQQSALVAKKEFKKSSPGFSLVVEGAERAVSVQPGEHQTQQDLINAHKYQRGKN